MLEQLSGLGGREPQLGRAHLGQLAERPPPRQGQGSRALASGRETTFADQYMCMTPQFDVSNDTCTWLTQNLFIGRGRLAGPRRIEYELYRVI